MTLRPSEKRAFIGPAARIASPGLESAFWLPTADRPEQDSGLIVLGIGKLGGYELNYSSDIDLIILYDPASARVSARDGVQSFFCPADARTGANAGSLHR